MKISLPLLLVLTLFSFTEKIRAQVLTEKLIVTDNNDSALRKADGTAFDKVGNYCFKVEIAPQKHFFYTNKDTLGPFENLSGVYGSRGDLTTTHSYQDGAEEQWFYKNTKHTKMYGPVVGKEEYYNTKNTNEQVAIVVSHHDSASYYINGTLVSKQLRDKAGNLVTDEWCAFSNNGNVIYRTVDKKIFKLYVNGALIDSSSEDYEGMEINDNGDYVYGAGKKPTGKNTGYDYMYYLHTKDTAIGPVRTVWNHALKDNGSYYFSGNDNATDYIAINNHLYKGIKAITNINIIDQNHYSFTFKQDNAPKINVNGIIYQPHFQKIFYPSFDDKGNFACFGFRDYYIYKYVNGEEAATPTSKYGVRPEPLYISPDGNALLVFKTDDSLYLYRNDSLLFKPFSPQQRFDVSSFEDFTGSGYRHEDDGNAGALFYLETDSAGYIVYKGNFSKPMKLVSRSDSTRRDAQTIMGKQNDHGFFVIKNIAKGKYLININNRIYKEVEGIDVLLRDQCFFDAASLVFYGIKGNSFYQYTLSL